MIYVTGDTHGLIDTKKLARDEYIRPEDYLIIAGDTAMCWDGGKNDAEFLAYWSAKPYTVLWVDGNHENFAVLNEKPVEEWHGGKVHRIAGNVLHLMRGEIFEIEGKTFFAFGGGLSLDKAYRTPYVSWWPEEEPSVAECEYGMQNLEKRGGKVDYVVTHAAPQALVRTVFSKVHPLIGAECKCERYLQEIYDKLDFELWICGHYHFDHLFRKEKVLEMYQDVVRLSDGWPICNTKSQDY